MSADDANWPELPLEAWQSTCETLHLWTQIVGKIRLSQMPWINHSWHVPLYVSARGLTTSAIPYGYRSFEIAFDFIDHVLALRTSDGESRTLPLGPQSVAHFYRAVFAALAELDLACAIHASPNEIENAIPFATDTRHADYDAEYANRFWRILLQSNRVMQQFRARFIGKCSPVHFFWGSFDLAVTRFSGRPAPAHPGGIPNLPDWVAREAYSHEVSSCGFWPGGGSTPYPLYYSYAYPAPAGFSTAAVSPPGAVYNEQLGEFVLAYEEVRNADCPDAALTAFLQSTYEAAAGLAAWDRDRLERACDPRSAV
ncbi:MAG: DUF5996 family protein [Rhodanobacteraceae bacterium]